MPDDAPGWRTAIVRSWSALGGCFLPTSYNHEITYNFSWIKRSKIWSFWRWLESLVIQRLAASSCVNAFSVRAPYHRSETISRISLKKSVHDEICRFVRRSFWILTEPQRFVVSLLCDWVLECICLGSTASLRPCLLQLFVLTSGQWPQNPLNRQREKEGTLYFFTLIGTEVNRRRPLLHLVGLCNSDSCFGPISTRLWRPGPLVTHAKSTWQVALKVKKKIIQIIWLQNLWKKIC